MIIELSKPQFDALIKEALDGMDDAEYVSFAKRVADEAKLRGLNVTLRVDLRVNLKEKRVTRKR